MITLPKEMGTSGKTKQWNDGTKIIVTTRNERITCLNVYETENDWKNGILKVCYVTNSSNWDEEKNNRYNRMLIPIETIILIQIISEVKPS